MDTAKNVAIFGLDEGLAAKLAKALNSHGATVSFQSAASPAQFLDVIQKQRVDLVFCPAEAKRYLPVLEAVKQRTLDVPVIVVSRYPDIPEWLDAIEAGAADYCAPPFESRHVQWLLQSGRKARAMAA